jgi:cation diffusion facilitator family transporter
MPETIRLGRSHSHVFDEVNPLAEARTRQVMWLTAAMMVVEIAAGWAYNSMALLADGWHMSSHAVALGVSALAYVLARRLRDDPRFAFGTSKIEVLGGYTSALLLAGVAAYMAIESVLRILQPVPIEFSQATGVAVIGLVVNLYSAWLLASSGHAHDHDHDHDHSHDNSHDHGQGHAHGRPGEHAHAQRAGYDLNLRAAYTHVIADAATSVLAILALTGGQYFGFTWLDPVMGIVGAVLVAVWAAGLLRASGRALLDAEMNAPVVAAIREVLDRAPVRVQLTDLHVWRVGKGKYACVLSLVAEAPVAPDDVRRWLSIHEELVHVTVEVNVGAPAAASA